MNPCYYCNSVHIQVGELKTSFNLKGITRNYSISFDACHCITIAGAYKQQRTGVGKF